MSRPHPFMPGIWYLMINIPLLIFVKSGITGNTARKRAKQVSKAAPGIAIPIFFVPTFFSWELEQWSHRTLRTINVRYYRGDGHTEWFLLPAIFLIIPAMVCVWAVNAYLIFIVIAGFNLTRANQWFLWFIKSVIDLF
jgi:hypothetical protein